MLILHSRRPRRWAGVALFAAALTLLWWHEHQDAAPDAPAAAGSQAISPWDSAGAATPSDSADALPPLLAPPHNAQFTGVPPSSSTSTFGATPTR